jgi:hypothetical protein
MRTGEPTARSKKVAAFVPLRSLGENGTARVEPQSAAQVPWAVAPRIASAAFGVLDAATAD